MAFVLGDDEGPLNGTAEVTLVAAPGAGVERASRLVTIANVDSAVVGVTLSKANGAERRVLWAGDLDPGDVLIWDTPTVVSGANKSLVAVMDAAATTTNPDWTSTWADET